jgi:hypothetical protein
MHHDIHKNAIRYFIACLSPFPVFAQDATQTSLVVEPSVARTIEGLPNGPKAVNPIRKVDYQEAMMPHATTSSITTRYEYVSKNLLNLNSLQRTKQGIIQSQTISLCGLIDIVGASSSLLNFDAPAPRGGSKPLNSFSRKISDALAG